MNRNQTNISLIVFFTIFLTILCKTLHSECFTIDYNGSGYEICTDSDGDITIDLDKSPWSSIRGTLTIPEGTSIVCRNFQIYGGNDTYENFMLINNGSIQCSGTCSIGMPMQNWRNYSLGTSRATNQPIFINSSSGHIKAGKIDVRYRYKMPDFDGQWESATSMNILSGQGQDLVFSETCAIKVNKLYIDCNISNQVTIEGDLSADEIESTKKIYVESDGTVTVGDIKKIPWSASIIVGSGGTLNLCKNPSSGKDDLGFVMGSILYNTAEWPNTDPQEECDVNYRGSGLSWIWNMITGNNTYKAENVVGAYSSYESCMENKPDVEFLGFDSDPFIQDKKEYHGLNDFNPCSEQFKQTVIHIEGMNLRRINGELIYCESDN